MTVLYFTATGNCLYVAKKIGGHLYSIPQMIKAERFDFEDDTIGLVFPNYGLCVPPYIKDFLSKAQFKCNYLFAIITYGTFNGGTTNHLLKIAAECNLNFSYINKLKMVQNWLPDYEMTKEIQKGKKRPIDEKLQQILSDIKEKKQWIYRASWLDQLLTKYHQKHYAYSIGIGDTKKYHVEENCNGCGICELVCPMDNINLKKERPVFGINCCSCVACIHNCPQKAIHKEGEKSSARYRNTHIDLKEIIASNR